MKGVAGAIGLTENDSSSKTWLVVCPETAHLIDEFKYSIGLYQLENNVHEHHDSNEASQVKFFSDGLQFLRHLVIHFNIVSLILYLLAKIHLLAKNKCHPWQDKE